MEAPRQALHGHAAETVNAVIGDLALARDAADADPEAGWAGVAAKLAALAGELADLAALLRPPLTCPPKAAGASRADVWGSRGDLGPEQIK